jgi:citrate synthase
MAAPPSRCRSYNGQIGPDVMDIRPVAGAGIFTYDPGFLATASTKSAITFIDGDKGVLLLSRLPDRAAGREVRASSRPATCCWYGELPTQGAAREPYADAHRATTPCCTSRCRASYQGFRRDAHPMAVMCGTVGALSAFYHDHSTSTCREHRELSTFRLIAKMPTIAAMSLQVLRSVSPSCTRDNELCLCGELPAHDASPRRASTTRPNPIAGARAWTAS